MIAIGISPLDKDSTVSVVQDGRVLYAASEERFTRCKQQSGFPHLAVENALEYCNIKPSDVDHVSYAFMPWEKECEIFTGCLEEEQAFLESFNPPSLQPLIAEAKQKVPHRNDEIHGLSNPNETQQKGLIYDAYYDLKGRRLSTQAARQGSSSWSKVAAAEMQRWQADLDDSLRRYGWESKLKRMDHHLSHAANSFYSSGFERALIITLDGYGTGLAGSASEGRDGKIHRLHGIKFPHSLGTMYEQVTSSLGFKPGRHEGKIVGLASYGDPEILTPVLLSRIQQVPGDYRIYGANNAFFARYLAAQFPKIDVAAAYQRVLEIVACNYVKHWVDKTGIDTVVLCGGVTANVKLNQRLFEIDGVNHIFVYPNMGDGGCGTGAAMYNSWPERAVARIDNAYLGPDFSETEMTAALDEAGLQYERPNDLAKRVATLISEGSVVARFDGRMEYGPRALGNRSIMYHAREPEVNQWLNKRLGRTEFMPFAPVTLYEARERCYHNIRGAEHTAEFMTITFDCTDEMKATCPAAVHVDGTARPQLIKRDVNPGYYDIVKEYEKMTGIPSLINTSFNMHEEPIVCNPRDAVRAFVEGNLDCLAIGPFLAKR